MTDTSGLVYLRARYYLPGLGVFPSLDPVEEGNRYGYVGGNVINFTDPSGECWRNTTEPDQAKKDECFKTFYTKFGLFNHSELEYWSGLSYDEFKANWLSAYGNIPDTTPSTLVQGMNTIGIVIGKAGNWILRRLIRAAAISQIDSPVIPLGDIIAALDLCVSGIEAIVAFTSSLEPPRRQENCGTKYPGFVRCESLPNQYIYANHYLALEALKNFKGERNLRLSNPDIARRDCPQTGTHWNVRGLSGRGSDRYGSIICCPCCQEFNRVPQQKTICRFFL